MMDGCGKMFGDAWIPVTCGTGGLCPSCAEKLQEERDLWKLSEEGRREQLDILSGKNAALRAKVEELEAHIKETLTTAAEDTKKLREEKQAIWEKWQQAEACADSERKRADILVAMLSEEREANLESEARAERLEAMLLRVEWVKNCDAYGMCPWCERDPFEGHAPDCEWEALMG